ncbi:peptide/nickel transport system ATP-binding protein [Rhizobium petrolearium]|uniref:ABC transporter ATP-binding protein n=1 Tax=Neorhizobium petrolearium TaxID=515361 RepID=UPI001AE7B909|nr:ABC transporter ATP-binding protein [Neorhizobium petrolearium]MBP1846531.1 peptide/nickel transport system ATP-binding protein [Neorhizobium petrolearium]
MTENLLTVTGLSAVSDREGGMPVLRDVGLTLKNGGVRGLVGESGAGKSTIAKAILGILPRTVRITGGWINFKGRDLLSMKPQELRSIMGSEIALIPQDPQTALNPARRIGAQLADGLKLKRDMSARTAEAHALQLLADVQIRDPDRVMKSFPHQLSGGMRQRVLIAAAFAVEPELVIADEPTTALDVTVQKEILRLIRHMQSARGTGVLFVTHDLGIVAQICDSVTLLYAGKVIEEGPVRNVLENPNHAYTKALIAAGPRYDRPDAGLEPVPEAVFRELRQEIGIS